MTFVDGHKSTFRKVESIQAQREKEGYLFTFLGTSDELIDGKEPEDWNPIILQFGRALCPYGLQVTEQGELTGVHDFETVKKVRCTFLRKLHLAACLDRQGRSSTLARRDV